MAIDFEDYLTDVLPSVPDCPEAIALQKVRDAAIRLCIDSTIYRVDIAAGDLTKDEDDYLISPPSGTEVIQPESVLVDDEPIKPATEEELDLIDEGWRTGKSGTPFRYIVPNVPGRIKFNRIPDETIADAVVVRVSLMPSRTATDGPDWLYNYWKEGIVHGALHMLMQIPGKYWTNPDLANFHGRHFSFWINRAKARATMGQTKRPASVALRDWV